MMCSSGLSIHFDRHGKCSENIQLLCLSSPGPMQTRQLIQAKQVSRRTHAQINTPAPAAFNTRRKVVLASKPTKLPCVLAKPNSSDDVSFRPIDPFRSPLQMLGKYSAFMSVITRTLRQNPKLLTFGGEFKEACLKTSSTWEAIIWSSREWHTHTQPCENVLNTDRREWV